MFLTLCRHFTNWANDQWSWRSHGTLFVSLYTEVDLICPLNLTVSTDPGSSTAKVNWQEPDLTGWDETNFTSTAFSGEAFPIGSQRVTYQQWFGINNLVLTCSFEVDVVGKLAPLFCIKCTSWSQSATTCHKTRCNLLFYVTSRYRNWILTVLVLSKFLLSQSGPSFIALLNTISKDYALA